MTEPLMAGIDLHSNNLVIGIVDQSGQRLKHQKLDCNLQQVEQFLSPKDVSQYGFLKSWNRPREG